MSSVRHADFLVSLVFISLCALIDVLVSGEQEVETSISRSLDLSIPAWRPLVQNPYQHQYYQHHHHLHHHQNAPNSAHLISYAQLNPVNKEEIIEAAKHNAQALKKYNEFSHQPITSYSNPYPYFSQTPGPLAKVISTTAFLNPNLVRQQQQQPLVAASNHIHARLPFPGKAASLYSTKLNYLGKPELSVALHHQNSIHQTVATTPKIAGFTKEQGGRVNFHYHHPSFGMVPIYDTTTKRIPMFSSSVTPQSTTKVHPVMSKFQAHMALAAMAQQNPHNNKLKHAHRPVALASGGGGSSNEFSPPSQIVSNYANYESATRVPLWHHGSPVKISSGNSNSNNNNNHPHHHAQHTADFHHFHIKPEAHQQQQQHQQQYQQQHQQVMPSVHPSIITPFLEQVHLKQKQVAAAEQKQSFKQSHEANSNENISTGSGTSFEIVNDVFSQHLVPPPPSSSTATKTAHGSKKKPEKVKFNLSMKSPLQDASRFNYNNIVSTATPATPLSTASSSTRNPYRQQQYQQQQQQFSESFTVDTEKPNLFVNLNRSKENPYKQHKLLHPGYSGVGLKKKPTFNHDKAFLPTPYKPTSSSSEEEREEEIKIDFEPQHSYFTIEDAVTPHFPESMKYDSHRGDELEIITLRPPSPIRPTKDYAASVTSAPHTTTSAFSVDEHYPVESSSAKPRQKLRRRKPKPQTSAAPPTTVLTTTTTTAFTEQEQQQQHVSEEYKPIRQRGSVRVTTTSSTPGESEATKRARLNAGGRLRTRPTSTTADYDYTIKSFEEELRRSELATTQTATTESTTSTRASAESSEAVPDVVRHRVRLRYKSKLNANAKGEGLDFKSKLSDSQISDTENDNVLVRQPLSTGGDEGEEETPPEPSAATENPYNEIKSSLKLPNLKLRNEAFTTLPPTAAETTHSSTPPSTAAVATAENDESNLAPNKIANRPRFSIKELKRKQYLTSSTAAAAAASASPTALTSSTSSTTQRPDSQRFNRFRLNLNRRRNETTTAGESSEETEPPRKRFSSTRFSSSTSSSTTTESPTQSSTRRSVLPKRTFPVRNFTKPHSAVVDSEASTTSVRTTAKSTTVGANRHNLRQRIQSYKPKKDTSNEIAFPTAAEESIRNVNFETTLAHEQPSAATTTAGTSTELPITRETSIMKIAKTPSSVKAATSNSNLAAIEDTLLASSSVPGGNNNDSTDLMGAPSDYSQRVAELTISGNEDSTFKSANIGLLSRRIPNYFTISTDDPILPIQAFFPQIKTNESI